MLPIRKQPIIMVVLASMFACTGEPRSGTTGAPITEAEIQTVNQEWLEAEQTDDGMRAGALFVPDGILVTARGRVDGQAAITQFWREAFAAQAGSSGIKVRIVKWGASGDIGYAVGRFEGGLTAPAGHSLFVVQRQEDGSVKMIADFAIPDAPPAR